MVKRISLKPDQKPDYLLWGISSSESLHRLCWQVNTQLSMQLRREADLSVPQKGEKKKSFGFFADRETDAPISYALIDNKSEGGWFLEEYKNIDYLFQVLGEVSPQEEQHIQEQIKAAEGVYGVFKLDTGRLKNPSRLDVL